MSTNAEIISNSSILYIQPYISPYDAEKVKFLLDLNWSDVPQMIFILVYRYRHPNSCAQKRKYTFLHTDIFCHKLCVFLPFEPK